MLGHLYNTSGVHPPDHLLFLETRPTQELRVKVWCKTAEEDCITPGRVKYLRGSIWFDILWLDRVHTHLYPATGGYRRMPKYGGAIEVRDNAAHPVTDVVIELVESEDGSIFCLNLAGEEVLSVPPDTDAQELRHELAKMKGKHANLHLINERGEPLPQEDVWGVMRGENVFIPPAS